MKKLSQLVRKVSMVMVYSIGCLQTAYADDTEIFYAPPEAFETVKPNILFIVDTSGSMREDIEGNDTNVVADQKISIVKDVMEDLLTELGNVNAGLMSFNRRRGGPIIHPVMDLDLPSIPLVVREITERKDDAVEGTLSKIVNVSKEEIVLNNPAGKTSGVRFTELLIPQGATITKAAISFTAKGDSSGDVSININGELSDSALTFNEINENITSRPLTSTSITWSPIDWSDGLTYETDDLTDIVQEIVDQAGWCGSNNMAFVFEGASGASRTAYSVDGKASLNDEEQGLVSAARISIEYDPNTGGGGCIPAQQTSQITDGARDVETFGEAGGVRLDFNSFGLSDNDVGVSFGGLNIPSGSKIVDAYIRFYGFEDSNVYHNSSNTHVNIFAVNDATPPTSLGMLSAPLISTPVSWSIPERWRDRRAYFTTSIKSLVQSLVNLPGWTGINGDMSFVFKRTQGERRAYTYNGNVNGGAKLFITYESVYAPGALTVREDLKRTVRDMPLAGSTPISDAIAEAGRYFKGESIVYGADRRNNSVNRVSHARSYAGGNLESPVGCTAANPGAAACAGERITGSPVYISPVVDACQSNHIVYLTDGAPTEHHVETEQIFQEWTGSDCFDADEPVPENEDEPPHAKSCAVNIAGHLKGANDTDEDRLRVTTHMIGFGSGFDQGLMHDMGDAGGGGNYDASTRAGLVEALSRISDRIDSVSSTFVTTGVTVNQNNRITHDDELYFSLFSPESDKVWPGNIKRYRLDGGEIKDANDVLAVNPLTAEFNEDAKSYWSNINDGKVVSKGGMAGNLTTARVIYSNIASGDLTADQNRFNETNITNENDLLRVASSLRRRELIHWTLGYDIDDEENYDVNKVFGTPPHKRMADPLHSQPTVVSYLDGGTETDLIYVGTNDGFLRAIDAAEDKGEEVWSFIPKELLSNLDVIEKNEVIQHSYYGMDGAVSVYINDVNNNGRVDVGSDSAYLYVGMRRGGNSYYALDISDPRKPSLMFIISSSDDDVGPGLVSLSKSPTTLDYSLLGQTWSRPVIGRINLPDADFSNNNDDKLVMIFGGGYDTAHDVAGTASTTATSGKIIYIADALDGRLLWSSVDAIDSGLTAGSLNSIDSVPADITAFDLDNDQFIDHFYASDTKAQIFRFDVNNEDQNINGGRIAALQPVFATEAGNRRFYYPVDASLINLSEETFVAVSIGSGYRAHPLNTDVADRFYMIKDKGVLSGTFDMEVTEDNLANVTNLIGDSDENGESDAAEVINDEEDPKNGWYLTFANTGEKVIERSITFNNAVIFTTYVPASEGDVCAAVIGSGRVYGVRVSDGNPYIDTNFDGVINNGSDRFTNLKGGGIAPPPQVLLEGTDTGVKARLCVGTQCGSLDQLLPPLGKGITSYKWLNAKVPE